MLKLWRCGTLALGIPGEQPIKNGAIITEGDIIKWTGQLESIPSKFKAHISDDYEFPNQCITPGLVDCHTHLVYAGQRAQEWADRLSGDSYENIASRGGGIQSTVQQTQACSEDKLFEIASKRLRAMCESGVTTLEIKSGYGLDLENEAKMLQVAARLEKNFPVSIVKTYLGLHVLPLAFKDNRETYLKEVIENILPNLVAANLVDAVDAFCEKIAFTKAEIEKLFKAAQHLSLGIKLHSEQLSDMQSAQLAAKFNALSVDHLEFISQSGIRALAKSKTVAVLLPGAYYFLKSLKKPPVALLRDNGVKMAIATDCNPGSSPTTSLLLMMNMACTFFDLTPEEAFLGVTYYGAQALGLSKICGSLEPNKKADFVVWDIEHPMELVATLGMNPCENVIKEGCVVYDKKDCKSL